MATRTVPINGRYIRGYCLPDYASKATTIKTEAEGGTTIWTSLN